MTPATNLHVVVVLSMSALSIAIPFSAHGKEKRCADRVDEAIDPLRKVSPSPQRDSLRNRARSQLDGMRDDCADLPFLWYHRARLTLEAHDAGLNESPESLCRAADDARRFARYIEVEAKEDRSPSLSAQDATHLAERTVELCTCSRGQMLYDEVNLSGQDPTRAKKAFLQMWEQQSAQGKQGTIVLIETIRDPARLQVYTHWLMELKRWGGAPLLKEARRWAAVARKTSGRSAACKAMTAYEDYNSGILMRRPPEMASQELLDAISEMKTRCGNGDVGGHPENFQVFDDPNRLTQIEAIPEESDKPAIDLAVPVPVTPPTSLVRFEVLGYTLVGAGLAVFVMIGDERYSGHSVSRHQWAAGGLLTGVGALLIVMSNDWL